MTLTSYPFQFIGTNTIGADQYLQNTLVYAFRSEKSGHQYQVNIERYVEHLCGVKFFDQTTDVRTGKFTLYVGDDCSPEPIGEIVEQYRDKIELIYQRFDTNLGGKDLVAQWERCIAMSKEEPYIWLFSDDDVMEPDCVEKLLRQIEMTEGAYDLYHFDVHEINEEGKITNQLPAYPDVLKAYDYYKGKYSGRFRSYVVENVFSRRAYKQAGGFKNFDLAWGSDVATWCIFCGIKATTELEEGREIKIPKLESKQSVRKKLKQQTSAKH